MITIKKSKLEKIFNKKVIPITCIGLDVASRTGYSKIIPNKNSISIDYGFIDIDTTDKYFKYDRYIEAFDNLLKAEKIVIEESYYSLNVHTFQLLSRIGAFAYCLSKRNNIKNVEFIMATSARKYLGFKGNLNKKVIQKQFLEKLNLELEDEDIIDALILSLNGILK